MVAYSRFEVCVRVRVDCKTISNPLAFSTVQKLQVEYQVETKTLKRFFHLMESGLLAY